MKPRQTSSKFLPTTWDERNGFKTHKTMKQARSHIKKMMKKDDSSTRKSARIDPFLIDKPIEILGQKLLMIGNTNEQKDS